MYVIDYLFSCMFILTLVYRTIYRRYTPNHANLMQFLSILSKYLINCVDNSIYRKIVFYQFRLFNDDNQFNTHRTFQHRTLNHIPALLSFVCLFVS